jgi:hypothetical protein
LASTRGPNGEETQAGVTGGNSGEAVGWRVAGAVGAWAPLGIRPCVAAKTGACFAPGDGGRTAAKAGGRAAFTGIAINNPAITGTTLPIHNERTVTRGLPPARGPCLRENRSAIEAVSRRVRMLCDPGLVGRL